MRVIAKYSILFCLWSLPLLFHKPVESTLDLTLVNPILSKFQESKFSEFIFFLVALIAVAHFIYWKVSLRMHVDLEAIMYTAFLAGYVAIYRFQWFGFDHYQFNSLASLPAFKYVDLVFLVPVLLIIHHVVPSIPFKKNAFDSKYALQGDPSIDTVKGDKLARGEFAELVTKCILNTKEETLCNSFAIGINAKWGDGKTSFQKMIEEKLRAANQGCIMLTFNAWKSPNEKRIIGDFFETYSSEIGKYDLRLGKRILRYGMKLLSSQSRWSFLIPEFLLFNSNQDEIFTDINNSLGRIKRKVIVFIDDADRLSTKEILEVVKLIRNSANFRNTFFVVGYDQEYLDTALKDHNEYGQADFLEKIFQIQFDLSQIPPNVIIQQLKDLLEEMLPEYTEDIRTFMGYQPTNTQSLEAVLLGKRNQGDFIPGLLKNLRDVKRFANFFSMNFRLVASEVIFEEFLLISLVRFKYPLLVRKIRENEKAI